MISKFETNYNSLMHRHFDSLGVLSDVVEDFDFRIFKKNLNVNEPEYNKRIKKDSGITKYASVFSSMNFSYRNKVNTNSNKNC